MKDISFYLIHNNSKDRIDLRNRLQELANKLNIKIIEIYKQRKFSKIKFSWTYKFTILRIYFLRIFYNLIHKKDFSLNFFCLLLKSFLNLYKYVIDLIFKNSNEIMKSYKYIMIESIVTKKHIKAWEHFLKSKKQIMIVFEDDAICKNDTEERLKDLFSRSESFNFDNFFIDLAGGLNLENIFPQRRIKICNDEFLLLKGIYTNTACSYLVSRNLIKLFYAEYKKTETNKYFPIDHLINKLGLKIKKNYSISSVHFHNPLFTHGSFKGNIKSWQNY